MGSKTQSTGVFKAAYKKEKARGASAPFKSGLTEKNESTLTRYRNAN
jgi:hypothetical protein